MHHWIGISRVPSEFYLRNLPIDDQTGFASDWGSLHLILHDICSGKW